MGLGFNTAEAEVFLISLLVVEGENRRKFVSYALRPYIMLPWVLSVPAGTVVTVTLLVEGFKSVCEEGEEGGEFMCVCLSCPLGVCVCV